MQKETKFQVVVKGKRKPKSTYDHERDKEMLEMLYGNPNKAKNTYDKAKEMPVKSRLHEPDECGYQAELKGYKILGEKNEQND
jgi:hypothetical protein